MKQRSIVKMFILEIVTFGIYRLYWFFKTRKELMARTNVKIPSAWFLLLPIFIVVGGVGFSLASSFGLASKINDSNKCMTALGYTTTIHRSSSTDQSVIVESPQQAAAQKQCDSENGVSALGSLITSAVIFVAFIFYLPLLAWWMWHYCEAVEVATNEKISRVLGMVLFLVVPDGVDILIVQDYFNKVPAAQGAPVS